MSEVPTAVRRPALEPEEATSPISGKAWWDGAGVWVAVGLVVVAVAARFPSSPVTGFTFDTGIQMNLARLTAEGAVPIRDFEHGWNAGSWYIAAALWQLVGRSPDRFWYAFSAGGTLLAGLCVVWVLHRRGVGQLWLLALTAGWLATARVAHIKYAVPAAVLAVVVWTWRRAGGGAPLITAGMFAVLVVTHVELAVLLGAGLVLFELAHAPALTRATLPVVLAAPLGVVIGLGIELAGFAALGVEPGQVIRHLVWDQTTVDPGVHFGYPLLDPGDLRTAVLPAVLLLPFLPAVWTSLHRITRLTACLQLGLVLITLRRTDSAHVAAATTLLPLLVGLAVLDVQGRLGALRSTGMGRIDNRWLLGGLAGVVATVVLGFSTPSLVAAPVLAAGAISGIALARWASPRAERLEGRTAAPQPAVAVAVRRATRTASATLGGLFGGIALLAVSLGGQVVARASNLPGDVTSAAIASSVSAPLASCTGGDPRVWVVPHPLGLYADLELENPTPFVMFHYPFAREHDRVMAMVDSGQVPTILAYGPWLPSFRGLEDRLEAAYTECARLDPPVVDQTVRILRWNGL